MGTNGDAGSLAVGFCLDESGSMSAVWQATIDGFNEYINDLRKQGETLLSLTLFSDRFDGDLYRRHCEAMDIGQVPELTNATYRPDGNTPLFDAIGYTIKQLESQLKDQLEQPDAVLFVIQTDGHENASREYSRQQVVDLIQRKEADGWRFIYLGANQDEIEAESASVSMGLQPGSSMSYDYAATDSAVVAVASASAMLRSHPTTSSQKLATATATERDRREQKKRRKPSGVTRSEKPNF